MQEKIEEHETWDKKKIVIFILLVGILVAGGIYLKTNYFVNPQKQSLIPFNSSQEVEGVSTESYDSEDSSTTDSKDFSSIPNNIRNNVQEKLDSIKQQITNLNAVDVATSSPQVQKIINDLKSLEQYPSNQAKEMCQKICTSF